MDLCFSHSLRQLIEEPTETTERTKTLVDHILTNSPEILSRVALLKQDYLSISSLIVQEKLHF